MRFFIDLTYDGQPFHGWQKQPNAITVQEVVEDCFTQIFQREINLVGAGRTDTGVHAKQLIAHFDVEEAIDPQHLTYKLNRMLPPAIAVTTLYRVHAEAHARFDALARTYQYFVTTRKNPFTRGSSALIKRQLDVRRMNGACAILKAHRNFQCFSKVKTDVKTYNCSIKQAYWEKVDDGLVFTITADRFLRNMVRAIVGTLLDVGTGKCSVKDLQHILESKDRCRAGKSVAAKGLFLCNIEYPKSIREN